MEKELYEAYPKNVDFKNGLAISFYKLDAFSRGQLKDNARCLRCNNSNSKQCIERHFF